MRSLLVRATMRGIRRELGSAQRQAKPLLREDLFRVLDAMGEGVKDARDRALLLIGFAGGFRRSEIVALDCDDVERVRQGLIVTLRRSKTDQEGAGRKIGIPFGRTRHCPVLALDHWLAVSGIEGGPVFRPWAQGIAEAEAAIADNPNNAAAYAEAGFWKMFLGHSEDGFSGLETALRLSLSPRDPIVPVWQVEVCGLHAFLAQWEQAIEWCNKARAGAPEDIHSLIDLAAANAWSGHDKEAKEAAAQLQKVYPGFTVQKWAGNQTDDRTFNVQLARIAEGLRKAGLPEGDKPADAAANKSN